MRLFSFHKSLFCSSEVSPARLIWEVKATNKEVVPSAGNDRQKQKENERENCLETTEQSLKRLEWERIAGQVTPEILEAGLSAVSKGNAQQLKEIIKNKKSSLHVELENDAMAKQIAEKIVSVKDGEKITFTEAQLQWIALQTQRKMDNKEVPLDLNDALPRFYNDMSFFTDLCHDLVSHMPERLKEINSALCANNAGDLYRHAHNLKGVSSNFSAGPISRMAAQLEAIGKSGELSLAPNLVKQIETEAERLRLYCASEFGVE